jgi:hypothetical protein
VRFDFISSEKAESEELSGHKTSDSRNSSMGELPTRISSVSCAKVLIRIAFVIWKTKTLECRQFIEERVCKKERKEY